MAQHTGTWKSAERAVARILGGRRLGPGGDRADVRSRWLCVEVKHRKSLPEWLHEALHQAQGYAGPGQLPVAVLHEEGTHYMDSIVCMSLRDFEAWFGRLTLPDGDADAADVAAGLEAGLTIAQIAAAGGE